MGHAYSNEVGPGARPVAGPSSGYPATYDLEGHDRPNPATAPPFGTPGNASNGSVSPNGTPASANGTPLAVDANGQPIKPIVIRGRRTASLQALQGVLLTPTGKVRKVHECPEPTCTAAFRRSEHLKRHYKSVHIGRRPFPCDWAGCDKTFSRNDNKQQHMSMVHGVKLPTAQTPPPGGAPAGAAGRGASQGLNGVEETDGGPELAAAFERKRVRDAQMAADAEAGGDGKGLGLVEVKVEHHQASGLADLLAAATATEEEQAQAQGEGTEGVEDVDAEGEEVDEEAVPEVVENGFEGEEPPAKRARLQAGGELRPVDAPAYGGHAPLGVRGTEQADAAGVVA